MNICYLVLLACSGMGVASAVDFLKSDISTYGFDNAQFRAASRGASNSKSMVRCRYVYPEWRHAHLFLSNIMNELAKIFVRVSDYVEKAKKTEIRRIRHRDGVIRKPLPADNVRVARFRVVSTKNVSFFDHIFSNMIDSFNKFCRQKMSLRSRSDPCQHQTQIKQIWAELLDNSLAQLRAASVHCVKLYMKAQNRPLDARAKNKLGRYLLNEFKRLRSYQLDSLCYKHDLCYHELLPS